MGTNQLLNKYRPFCICCLGKNENWDKGFSLARIEITWDERVLLDLLYENL